MYDTKPYHQLKAFDFYLLRVPLLPYSTLLSLHANCKYNTNELTAAIKTLFVNPLLQEAIYLASPDLYATLQQWLLGTVSLRSQKEHKLALTLYKYLVRMCTRCTPYGLFAGCASGTISQEPTHIVLAADPHHKVTRLDMHYLSSLADELLQDETISTQLKYHPNTSLYLTGATYRYYEYQLKDKKRHYFLSTFTNTPYLEQIIAAAGKGANLHQLIAVLTNLSIPAADAADFIKTLIQNQILVSPWHPTITGPDYFRTLSTQLEAGTAETGLVQLLKQIQHLLDQPGIGTGQYTGIRHILQTQFPAITGKDVVQVDLFYKTRVNNISAKTIATITGHLQQLTVLNQATAPGDLQNFCKKFYQRYEEREMPLMTVLDSESGIGYGMIAGDKTCYTPLVDDLVVPGGMPPAQTVWNVYNKLVLEKFTLAQKENAYSIELTDADLQQITPVGHTGNLPATACLMGTLLATDNTQLEEGNFQFIIKSCGGPGALALMGRFAAGDSELTKQMKACVNYEQSLFPDKIVAEVIHLPEGRTGNVLLRPQLYDYEIPFLGTASVDEKFQLSVSDLYVTVKNNIVILRSKSLNKEIIPRLTSAHNYTQSLAIYKFLCDLQNQYAPFNIQWDWNIFLNTSFLPRISYRQLVLKRARWLLFTNEFNDLLATASAAACLQLLLIKYNLPEKVVMAEGDNELFLDLSCEYAQALLTDKLQKGDVVLYESLVNEDNNFVMGAGGSHCNEMVIPFYHTSHETPVADHKTHQAAAVARSFTAGSEWLYAKIYCGAKWIDKLLTKELLPLVTEFKQTKIITQWFYIRYQDPDSHLRIRFRNTTDPAFSQHIISRLNQVFEDYITNDIVHKIQYDTYIREIERYGNTTIELSEQFFFHDSEAVIELLPVIQTIGNEHNRWLFALKGVDCLLNDFGYTTAQKLYLLQQLQHSFFQEFNGDGSLLYQLNNKYRNNSKTIDKVLTAPLQSLLIPATVIDIFHARSIANKAINQHIVQSDNQQKAGTDGLRHLVPDYIHLFLNRLFVANQRLHELVIYHYLLKHYTSVLARDKTKMINNPLS
ncbi:thiopeptide-type bacteriocin biosynthesis protein [Chitinophaga niastensis]|uniref:Thiopeptide-type bacteriocin biosynthesis protein n=1 Tax=Chitinophaga niastensis TaxID=536980 RepID=A0A2P8HTE7_CHINA|nr:lantibiotic dehydratase [Chitinophaga niastensis]PSL49478.1 thiopeptide-type bacteriocin biosynthesis protein [Chitinophaga niastensis]